jgi:uncharacterized protein YqgV (UPF0045/DUF77 family)
MPQYKTVYEYVRRATIHVRKRYVAEVSAMLDSYGVSYQTYPGQGWGALTVIRTGEMNDRTARQAVAQFHMIVARRPWKPGPY